MPIQEKDLGKYVRPGIYVEEIDSSIIENPPTQNVLINLVPGFSKKGPFNYPVYIETAKAFEKTFGTIDYQLERKGSYFHRTCLKMLETGPIWALNLLDTISGRDKLNYVSVSTTSKYDSSDLSNPYTEDYELFFNRQDFWERDTESFLDLVKDSNNDLKRLLHITNMGDKTVSVFLFKSTAENFDVTADVWYGGETKVPSYIHPKSLISDYLVNVLILEGNWTDYKKLSVDTTWSKYFTLDGLSISTIRDFVNEKGVNVIGNYDASLIPNFKDLNGRNMFIETLINDNTNSTSLFCAYNKDLLLDNDYLSDLVDLIGFTIVGTDKTSINFLSYNQSLLETKTYNEVLLDSPNNVFATDVKEDTGNGYSTTWLNWNTVGISYSGTTYNETTTEVKTTLILENASYVINGVKYTLDGTEKEILLETPLVGTGRIDLIYLDSNGVQVQTGTPYALTGSEVRKDITYNNNNTITLVAVKVTRPGMNDFDTDYEAITISTTEFITLPISITPENDSYGSYLKINFNGTQGTRIKNNEYLKLRRIKYYNELSTNLSTNKGVMIPNNGFIVSDIYPKAKIIDPVSVSYSSSNDAYIKIYIENPSTYMHGEIFYIDNEFRYTSGTVMTTSYTSVDNIVAKYSDFYQDYINGEINNGDYIMTDGYKNHLTMYVDDNEALTVTFEVEPTDGLPFNVVSDLGNWKQTLEIEAIPEITDKTNTLSFKINKNRYPEIKKGMYIEAYYDEEYYAGDGFTIGDYTPRKLVRIINTKNDSVNTDLKIIYTDGPIKINEINETEWYTTVYPPIYQYATHLKGAALNPFKINVDSIPNGTEARLNTILNVMAKGTQMFKGLVNKNKISWRYLVDSFGLGLSENSKQQYLDLCGKKLNCLGFINMPSVKDFKKSYNPSFVDEYGAFSTAYLKDGANLDTNPNFLYSFGEGIGRSTVGYFFPYIKHTVDGVMKEVPPAAFVASAYMRKQLSNSSVTYPWTIVAGMNDGIVSGIGGTEMDFTDDDLTNLAKMGANPITFVRNVGYIINDESTAQVFPISSLSYIHSREVLIELENELYDMLLRYQWKFNTPGIRSEIKYKADAICRSYVEKGGLYAFRNIIDTSNNTNYIIDLQGGVLDTHVEIVKGMGWIVNNITIEKTGTINSTGFGS